MSVSAQERGGFSASRST